MTQKEIFEKLKLTLEETFEIDPETITMEAKLNEDLDIDSIDAIDLLAQLRPLIGRRKINPKDFYTMRTVGDVVRGIEELLKTPESPQ